MTTTDYEARLTAAAQTAFENGAVFVYARSGVLWLAERRGTGFHTFAAVGIPRQGIRRLLASLGRMASEG
jgi:hypothetical protein